MRPRKDIENLIKEFDIDVNLKKDRQILDGLRDVQAKSEKSGRGASVIDIWRIIMQSKTTKFATAAAMMIVAIIGINLLNGTSAWAKVIKAFDDVQNVHVIQTMVLPDGTVKQYEIWLKKPDHLYQDAHNLIIIDNGKERLVIDKEKKTAQFSDSLMSYRPLEEHYMFNQIKLFRGESDMEIKFDVLDDEGDDSTIVFSIKEKNETSDIAFQGKAWVDAETMLPRKIQAELISAHKEGEPKSGEIIFDYKPISNDAFAMNIPTGFTELPRKQRGVMSGKVLDEDEQPVANAIVYATDRGGQFSMQIKTNLSGDFTFKLPPEAAGKPVWLPVMFRAFSEEIPDKVAWSIIRDPANRHEPGSGWEPGGKIPYEVGSVDNDGCILKSANGIILRMESSGTIAGQVSSADGNPIPNAKVQLLRCDLADKHGNAGLTGVEVNRWGGHDEYGTVRTDENGYYKLTHLPKLWKRTKFFVRAEAAGFAGDTNIFYAKGPIENEKVVFKLYQSKLTVNGRLIDNYGDLIVGAPIFVMVNGKRFQACNAKTDKNGYFKIRGCPDASDLQIKAELSHGYYKEGTRTTEYFPDVVKTIDYQKDIIAYEVEMIARRPELTLNVEVKNTSGELLKYFPVEIRGDSGTISTQWESDKKFIRRTDENGKCTFTEVPEVAGLKLVLHGGNNVRNEKPTEDAQRYITENKKKYFWSEVTIGLVEGKKDYKITAVALTEKEWKVSRKNANK